MLKSHFKSICKIIVNVWQGILILASSMLVDMFFIKSNSCRYVQQNVRGIKSEYRSILKYFVSWSYLLDKYVDFNDQQFMNTLKLMLFLGKHDWIYMDQTMS